VNRAKDDPIGQPLSILSNISRSLKPGAKAVLNGVAMLRRSSKEDVSEGRFDPVTMAWSSEFPPWEGHPPIPVRERAFLPMELVLLFRLAGMSVVSMWGGTAGNWGKDPRSGRDGDHDRGPKSWRAIGCWGAWAYCL